MAVELPSPEKCIEEFDVDGDGLLSMAELAVCLEAGPWRALQAGGSCWQAVLGRQGCAEAKSVALAVLEHWALRSDGLPAGAGALQRLLWAAQEAANRKE